MKKNKKTDPNDLNKRNELTIGQKRNIYTMFFGPYLKEWKDKKGIVLNGDKDIADRLKLDLSLVSNYISRICEEHFKKVYQLRLKQNQENDKRRKDQQQIQNKS